MNKVLVGILALIVLSLSSCEIDGTQPCIEDRTTAALINNFPDSIKVGNVHPLEVTYVLESSCGSFDRFDVSISDKSFDIELITKYEGCNCNLEFSEHTVTYEINLDYPGIYEYNFWQADGEYDTRTVTIFE